MSLSVEYIVGLPREIRLENVANLIDSLIYSGHVFLHQRLGLLGEQYHQLPFKVTIAYLKYKQTTEQCDNLQAMCEKFDEFISTLKSTAASHHGRYPDAEKAHAEYLLGFLLEHNLTITWQNGSKSLSEWIINKLSPLESKVMDVSKYAYPGPHYNFEAHLVPNTYYDFLSKEWRQQQNYPTIETVAQVCQTMLNEREELKKRAELEQAAQKAQELARQQWREQHLFENVLLDYKLFSYVLEGYVLTGRIGTTPSTVFNFAPKLSAFNSSLIHEFSRQARNPVQTMHQQLHLQSQLNCTLQAIFASARYDFSREGDAARLLSGFLLVQNIHVTHLGMQVTMRDMYWCLANPMEQQAMALDQLGHPNDESFLQALREIPQPTKKDLESVLSREHQPKMHLLQYPAYKTQHLGHGQMMDYQTGNLNRIGRHSFSV